LIELTLNGKSITVEDGTTVAAAILNSGALRFRRTVTGKERGPLCGMGVCFECRVTIDGVRHRRSCLVPATDGMVVETDE
jgi:aerobic-type carbon monoxide dehydrogenase small subunit (CoxS/CutS family)